MFNNGDPNWELISSHYYNSQFKMAVVDVYSFTTS